MNKVDKDCNHVWRIYGNYMDEEVEPSWPDRGFVECTKCKGIKLANLWKLIKRVPPTRPKAVWKSTRGLEDMPSYDTIVEILEL
jgi:hypothetical protein